MTAGSSPAQVGIPRPDHVVIVIEENHAYSDIIGSSAAPYINSLAAQGALFTESFGISHPSQPNYLALFSGSTQGITSDSCPHYFGASNLGNELFAAGYTFAGYSESMPADSFTGCGSGGYARKHNPWVNFTNVSASANLTLASFPTDFNALPTVTFVIPNLGNDMHNGSVRGGDSWLQAHLDPYVEWARTHNSLLIVTWDEDDRSENNHIATMFIGPMVQPGQYFGCINHYTVLRTLEDMFGLPYAGESANAAPILNIWTTGSAGLTAELTSPENGAVFAEPASVALVANAGSNVQKVEFFTGVTRLGERTSPPFALTWTNVPAGHHQLNVKVTDDHGAVKSSPPVEIDVLSGAELLARMQGTYNGLFYAAIQPVHASSGFVTLKTTAKGEFTGKLTASSGNHTISGQFDGSGSWSNIVARPGNTPLIVQLSVDLLNQPHQIHGTVSDGTWSAQLLADQAIFNTKTRPAPQAGGCVSPSPVMGHVSTSPCEESSRRIYASSDPLESFRRPQTIRLFRFA
jgi:phosphoesterase family protein/Big-like domain-containing protein